MVEGFLALFLLIPAVISGEASWYIASGVFAIATQISRIADNTKKERDKHD